ncbi:MAG TPA: Rho termination factor N-terminal domain-containing protein [Conexibacter sp.]|nr:Rho termination factor N-terminal domain-containing protein [Conexibacter sp.]
MPVLERSALADSPLADLHAIASELGIDGFRRLRKEELIDAIVTRQGGGATEPAAATDDDGDEAAPSRPRRRRGGRGRAREERGEREVEAAAEERPARRERGPREPAPRERDEAKPARAKAREESEQTVEGVVELGDNGSGFLRLGKGGTPSDEDVYVSAAQVRRCELVDGDRVGGPARPPRRSERYPSLVRVERINGRPAEEVAEGVRFDELPAAFPSERFAFEASDPAVQAVEFLTPIGRGSRVAIVGAAHTGKSETLRRLAKAFADLGDAELETAAVLTGARPEEIAEWREGPFEPAAALSFAAPADAQAQAVERAVEHGKRVAARGGHAVVLIDSLDGLPLAAARKALAAARNIPDGGSLTVIGTAAAPLGGETTVVALDAALAGERRFPAIDLLASRTLRPELLVGDAGAAAIAEAVREEA